MAVLATYMGTPKEGPSAGVATVTGIVSALVNLPARRDLAMTGESTLPGLVLPVGGIQQKVRAAVDDGVREVLLPADNLAEAEALPRSLLDALTLTPIQHIDEALTRALLSRLIEKAYPPPAGTVTAST